MLQNLPDFPDYLAEKKREIDRVLEKTLPLAEGPAKTVREAMRYAVLAGGKRIRPILAIAVCEACAGPTENVLAPAAALELVHTYSLIHDDLPAMDDDDLRRGRPTVHRAFGEAEAILAGDALQALAFEVLGGRPEGAEHAENRSAAVVALARGAGVEGMVGGQMGDLEGEKGPVSEETLSWIHQHKTGALFAASAEIGAIHAGADARTRSVFTRFGTLLGLAFQVADDILDCTSTASALGKTPGKDLRDGKATYPALLGMDASKRRGTDLVEQATELLRSHDLLTEPLRGIADLTVSRSR